MSVAELKAELKRLRLPQGGRKPELEARLHAAQALDASIDAASSSDGEEEEEEEEAEGARSMDVDSSEGRRDTAIAD